MLIFKIAPYNRGGKSGPMATMTVVYILIAMVGTGFEAFDDAE
jgi:hypothetical protein